MGNPADLVHQFRKAGTFYLTAIRWKQGGTENIVTGMAKLLVVAFRIGNTCIQQLHIRFSHDCISCLASLFSLTAVNHVPEEIDTFQIAIVTGYQFFPDNFRKLKGTLHDDVVRFERHENIIH